MRQSTYIFAVLLFLFVVYVTLRGQLPGYFALFSRAKSQVSPAGNVGSDSVFAPLQTAQNLAANIKNYVGGAVGVAPTTPIPTAPDALHSGFLGALGDFGDILMGTKS